MCEQASQCEGLARAAVAYHRPAIMIRHGKMRSNWLYIHWRMADDVWWHELVFYLLHACKKKHHMLSRIMLLHSLLLFLPEKGTGRNEVLPQHCLPISDLKVIDFCRAACKPLHKMLIHDHYGLAHPYALKLYIIMHACVLDWTESANELSLLK